MGAPNFGLNQISTVLMQPRIYRIPAFFLNWPTFGTIKSPKNYENPSKNLFGQQYNPNWGQIMDFRGWVPK